MLRLDETDQIFKNGVNDFEIRPPDYIWNNISNTLDQQKKTAKIFPFIWAMAASLTIIIGLFSYLNHQSEMVKPSYSAVSLNSIHEIKKHELGTTTVTQNNHAPIQPNIEPKSNIVKAQSGTIATTNMVAIKNHLKPIKFPSDNHSTPDTKTLKTSTKNNKKPQYQPIISNQYGYQTNNKKTAENHISLAAMIAPTYSYRTTTEPSTAVNGFEEKGTNNLSGGMNLQYKTKKRWRFEAGIFVTQSGQSITPTGTQGPEIENNWGDGIYGDAANLYNSVGTSNSLGKIKTAMALNNANTNSDIFYDSYYNNNSNLVVQQNLKYIELPLAVRYNLIDKKTIISISGGLCTNVLIDNIATVNNGDDERLIGETENIEPISYSSKVGIGLEYPFLNKVSIYVEPIFRYFITPINPAESTNYRPYSIGINTGLTYKF